LLDFSIDRNQTVFVLIGSMVNW